MSIAWKVINSETRQSCFAEGEFRLDYPEGETVKAVTNSMGIICSKSKRGAEKFIGTRGWLSVIKVRGIGKSLSPKIMSTGYNSDRIASVGRMIAKHGLKVFYKSRFPMPHSMAVSVSDAFKRSIICYPAVDVLE